MKLDELANKTKDSKKQNPVAKAMTQDPQFKSKVVPDKKKEMKAGYQKHKGKVEEVSSMGMNKYGLAAKNVDGKFYSYKDGKETGVFDSMEELKKHQEHLLQQMDKSHNQESVEEADGHEASMAKTQMFKTSQIAKQIHDMIERGEDLPGWIQSSRS